MVNMKRPKCETPLIQRYLKKYGFLDGYASVFNIMGTTLLSFPETRGEAGKSAHALNSDWHAVGGDLHKAFSLIDDESSHQKGR